MMNLRFLMVSLAALAWLGCGNSHVKSTNAPLTEGPRRTCELPMTGDWSMFQANAARLGAVSAPAIRNPEIVWMSPVGVQSWLNNPVISGNRVFVGSSGTTWNEPDTADGVYARDLNNGEAIWFRGFDNDVNGVAYASCVVVATSDDGTIRAMDASSGEEIWKHQAGAKVYTNPLILGEMVYVGDANGVVYALHLHTGKVRWTHALQSAIRGGMAGDTQHIYVSAQNGVVVALVAGTGERVWTSESLQPFEIYGVPTRLADRLLQGYVRDTGYQSPALTSFDLKMGHRGWDGSNTLGLSGIWGNIRSSPAVWNDVMIWGEPYSNRIIGGRTTTGEVIWNAPSGACFFPHYSSPAIASGTAYVGRTDGGLYAIDAATGNEVWSLYLGQVLKRGAFPGELLDFGQSCEWEPGVGSSIFASPAVAADGTIVIGTTEGWLYAIRERQ